jgi:hypothetical protein
MVLKIPQYPRHYKVFRQARNLAASLNHSQLHILKHEYATKVPGTRLLSIYLREQSYVTVLVFFVKHNFTIYWCLYLYI